MKFSLYSQPIGGFRLLQRTFMSTDFHVDEAGPSTSGRAEKKSQIKKEDTKSATTFEEYLARPSRKLDVAQPTESKPKMDDTRESEKFRRTIPCSQRGGKDDLDQMKYSSKTKIIAALQPQPLWRNKVLKDKST